MEREKIHVVGGGLVGSLAALVLAQRGFNVALYEGRPDIRLNANLAGRSINLAVTARGLKALEEVGLKKDVLELAISMKGRMLHSAEGQTTFVSYGQKENEVIHSVSRAQLNQLLLARAVDYKNVELHFQQQCEGYVENKLCFLDLTSQQRKTVAAERILATDGAHSTLRQTLSHFDFSESILEHGYKELVIPANAQGEFQLERNALHIWPRSRYMLIALPNLDGSFTVTFFFAHQGEESFATLRAKPQVEAFFATNFPDALALMPQLAEDFFAHPTGFMSTVRCQPWYWQDKLMLLGDAAHAIVPFFGQGMNCGFEDCSRLGELLDQSPTPQWHNLFSTLQADRKINSDAIADMALENFIEMRDTVADPKFQLKKQIGFELEKRYPERFIPRYSMVVFHPEISYAEACRRGALQDKILDQLSMDITKAEDVDWSRAAQLLSPDL